MVSDGEDWLLDAIDAVIKRRVSVGHDGLGDIEKAVYCLWVIDYAVRNSGAFGPVEELHPSAFDELRNLAAQRGYKSVLSVLINSTDEEAFCQRYYDTFEECVLEISHDFAAQLDLGK
jgi:hypothetical protein